MRQTVAIGTNPESKQSTHLVTSIQSERSEVMPEDVLSAEPRAIRGLGTGIQRLPADGFESGDSFRWTAAQP